MKTKTGWVLPCMTVGPSRPDPFRKGEKTLQIRTPLRRREPTVSSVNNAAPNEKFVMLAGAITPEPPSTSTATTRAELGAKFAKIYESLSKGTAIIKE